jgi:hypothetical protein
MSAQVGFALRGRNPDVLTCIANLSNDEVFTPPEFANRMLDTLTEAWAADNGGANIWADRSVRFLDPCTKSGVFLREITSRLNKGLAKVIPNLEERINHIPFVPMQKWSKRWTDENLYAKYSSSVSEIKFIEKFIRPMGESDE